jgi:hypothetical protein
MASTSPSTITPQLLIDYARAVGDWTVPTVGLAGYSPEPALSFCQDIMQKILAKNNPWKWNSYVAPLFYSQPYQQDFMTNVSSNDMGWLESATFTDINNPAGTPQYFIKPPLQCVARLLPTYVVGIPSEVSWLLNSNSVTGQWPGPGTLYLNPLTSQGGGPGNNPLTGIKDPNGNLQTVTTYGTTGTNQPTWPAANSPAGTTTNDGSVVWTVMDPNGVAFRVNMLATYGSNVWQFNVTYQKKPPLMTTLNQTFAPIPDDLQYLIKQGFLAYCWKKADKATFAQEYAQWLADIQQALESYDREIQTFGIYPADSLQNTGGGSGVGTYGYPGWWGWS